MAGDPERGEITNITADWAASSLIAYKNDRFESKKLLPIYQAAKWHALTKHNVTKARKFWGSPESLASHGRCGREIARLR